MGQLAGLAAALALLWQVLGGVRSRSPASWSRQSASLFLSLGCHQGLCHWAALWGQLLCNQTFLPLILDLPQDMQDLRLQGEGVAWAKALRPGL